MKIETCQVMGCNNIGTTYLVMTNKFEGHTMLLKIPLCADHVTAYDFDEWDCGMDYQRIPLEEILQ